MRISNFIDLINGKFLNKKASDSLLTPLFIGTILFFLIVGPSALDPGNASWISLGDPSQHYFGWVFFRQQPWGIPPGVNPDFGINLGASIVYSDSIPLLALFFKIFSAALPATFQYFGLWYWICFLLQALFAWLLIGEFTTNTFIKFIGAIFFCISPAFLSLLGITAALAGHFTILWVLFLILRKHQSHRLILFGSVVLASVFIHFYLFFIIYCLWISSLFDSLICKREMRFSKFITEIFTINALVFFSAWVCGYFISPGKKISADGYGDLALNIPIVFFDPFYSKFCSLFEKYIDLPSGPSYLGLGIVICFFISIAALFIYRKNYSNGVFKNLFLISMVVILTLISVTNKVHIGYSIYVFDLPEEVLSALGVLRSSAHLFWPFYYLITLFSIITIGKFLSTRLAIFIILICLIIQIADSFPLISKTIYPKFHGFGKMPFDSVLISEEWPQFANKYKKIVLMPEVPLRISFETFATYAARNHLATNSVLLARPDLERVDIANAEFNKYITSGRYDPDSLFIVDDDLVLPVLTHLDPQKDLFAKIDGFNVLAPGWVLCEVCKQPSDDKIIRNRIFSTPKMDIPILFGKNQLGSSFLVGVGQYERAGWGWSYPESWGAWSEGRQVKIFIPYPKDSSPQSLSLNLRAFISPTHPIQKIEVWVNGRLQKIYNLSQPVNNKVNIPLLLDRARDYVLIDLRLPNSISPKELGMGDDTRKLAIGLESAVLR